MTHRDPPRTHHIEQRDAEHHYQSYLRISPLRIVPAQGRSKAHEIKRVPFKVVAGNCMKLYNIEL